MTSLQQVLLVRLDAQFFFGRFQLLGHVLILSLERVALLLCSFEFVLEVAYIGRACFFGISQSLLQLAFALGLFV